MDFSDILSGANSINALGSVGSATGSLLNLLMVTPNRGFQPQPNKAGVKADPSFLFHFEGEQTATLESDITDHYVEDGTAVADHISLRPEIITTQGFIGEVNDVTPEILIPLKAIAEKLTVISDYTPSLSATAIRIFNDASQAYAAAEKLTETGSELLKTFTGNTDKIQNNQQKYFNLFYKYWRTKTLFTVQTPWAAFPNMAIRSLRTVQDPDTNVITSFELTFKRIRFAHTIVASLEAQGRAKSQSQGMVDQGTSTPTESVSLVDKLKNTFKSSFAGGVLS